MKNKLIYLLIFLNIFYSCSSNSHIEENTRTFTFKRKIQSLNQNKSTTYEDVKVIVTSFEPLVIESEAMEIHYAISSVTNELLEILSFIEIEEFSKYGRPTEKSGWIYNRRTDCFIYGTYTYYENGKVTFTFASKATQILMNNCGDNDGEPYTQTGFAVLLNSF